MATKPLTQYHQLSFLGFCEGLMEEGSTHFYTDDLVKFVQELGSDPENWSFAADGQYDFYDLMRYASDEFNIETLDHDSFSIERNNES